MSWLAYLLMLKIHEEAHRSARYVLQKSRSTAWVVKGKSLAERVVEACVECKIRKIMKATLRPDAAKQDLLSGMPSA